jgi:hypothetical protein
VQSAGDVGEYGSRLPEMHFIALHQRFRLQSGATASKFGTGQYLTIVR